jgi:hypothetical protein
MVTSSFCQDGGCVEVIRRGSLVAVQESDTDSDVVVFTRADWDAFVAGVKAGEFDWDRL